MGYEERQEAANEYIAERAAEIYGAGRDELMNDEEVKENIAGGTYDEDILERIREIVTLEVFENVKRDWIRSKDIIL